jgi:homoserine/homoserine lactone efflux protein
MAWATWLAFLAVELVMSLLPGPAVLFVLAQGLRHGAWRAFGGSLGILLGNALWFVLSALGLVAVLLALPAVYALLRWASIAWLAWVGVQSLRGGAAKPAAADAGVAATAMPSFAALLRRGVLLQLGNPKALLFFTAILPGFVAPASGWPPWLQVLVLGVTSIAAECLVLAGYGALAAKAAERLREPHWARRLDRVAGVLLLAVAAWLLAMHQSR